jgi:hypothetical protein
MQFMSQPNTVVAGSAMVLADTLRAKKEAEAERDAALAGRTAAEREQDHALEALHQAQTGPDTAALVRATQASVQAKRAAEQERDAALIAMRTAELALVWQSPQPTLPTPTAKPMVYV